MLGNACQCGHVFNTFCRYSTRTPPRNGRLVNVERGGHVKQLYAFAFYHVFQCALFHIGKVAQSKTLVKLFFYHFALALCFALCNCLIINGGNRNANNHHIKPHTGA